ncbi:hypothetical protein Bca52824_000832 [Brassica carinata]|uniref:Ubiquitin-like protease family profile domain-containing protein n=1 Tax=Brassica carinata TaxID=52824 RepID=A0A8X8BD76_BRACI|nr:hypothetical protein Bca52824_000832 [Brassica carinata]
MVSAKLVEIPDSPKNGEDLLIPDMMFVQGEEPNGVRVLTYQSSRAINFVLNSLEEDEIQTIRESAFGKLVEIAGKPSFSGRFTRYLLSRQLKVNKKHEVWFRFAGNPIRFSLREFAILTGLPCGKYPKKSKLKMRENLNEKPYWPTLFGKVEVVSVRSVVKMLRKKTVKDKNIRIKIACLALLSSVLLSTNLNMKIMREHAEGIEDIEEFFRFPWGRMAFDLLMSSVKERDEIALSQKSIALKGFVLAIQLVLVESVPSLTEVVLEHGSSSESDSEDDVDECRQKLGKKHTLSPGHARQIDSKSEVAVKSLIEEDPARPIDETSLQWSDEEEDEKVNNLLTLIRKGHAFSNDMFRGGATKADVERLIEVATSNRKVKRKSIPPPTAPLHDQTSVVNIVLQHLKPEVARLEENIASVASGMKDVSCKFVSIEDTVKSVIGPMLANFKEEVLKSVGQVLKKEKVEGTHKHERGLHAPTGLGTITDGQEGVGDINEEIIRNKKIHMSGYSENNLVFNLISSTYGTEIEVNGKDSEPDLPRKSKRSRAAPPGLRSQGAMQSYDGSAVIESKFSILQEKIKESFVINFMGLAVTSKDIADVVERVRPLSAKVVDILVKLLRFNLEKHLALPSGHPSPFFDTRFFKALSRAYPKFKRCKNRETFSFSRGLCAYFSSPLHDTKAGSSYYVPFCGGKKHWLGLCVNCSERKITVLDCNPTLSSDKDLATDLAPVCVMFPYLLKQAGGTTFCDVLTPFSIERPEGLVINYALPDSGLTAMLLLQSHALGGIEECKSISPANIAEEAKRAVVMVYEYHQKLVE